MSAGNFIVGLLPAGGDGLAAEDWRLAGTGSAGEASRRSVWLWLHVVIGPAWFAVAFPMRPARNAEVQTGLVGSAGQNDQPGTQEAGW